MENKLTDNEILKALECYRGQKLFAFNGKRPKIYIHDIIDLINRLQAKLDEAEDTIQFADKELKKAEAEVERLQNSIAVFTNNAVDFANEIDRHKKDKEEAFLFAANIVESEKIVIANAKAEAYKEFAERVKIRFAGTISCNYRAIKQAVDNLLKEMVGDK